MAGNVSALPEYERRSLRMAERRRLAAGFATQIKLTTEPFLDIPFADARVLDVGCGYGHTSAELARLAHEVVGVEPNELLAEHAGELARTSTPPFAFRRAGVESLGTGSDGGAFDVVVLDNVLEHLPDQHLALERVSHCLRPGGVVYILVPNKLWPIEAHYTLPFLSYLPLPLATRYLRLSGRGTDYRDASYAPTARRLRRLVEDAPGLDPHFTLPGDVSLAEGGGSALYRWGVRALRRWPALWTISKALLVVAVKQRPTNDRGNA
ncbi:class I SAM-dependent methyltransferase [Pseudonocardia sp. RS010]|uniref:class I SAM-dependent methyltransferase n=1 Tax=Pseudonocardia sp. RS010 TaxID=3385979 RepID=UPI0039A3908D